MTTAVTVNRTPGSVVVLVLGGMKSRLRGLDTWTVQDSLTLEHVLLTSGVHCPLYQSPYKNMPATCFGAGEEEAAGFAVFLGIRLISSKMKSPVKLLCSKDVETNPRVAFPASSSLTRELERSSRESNITESQEREQVNCFQRG